MVFIDLRLFMNDNFGQAYLSSSDSLKALFLR